MAIDKQKANDTIRVYAPSRGNLALSTEAAPKTRVAAEPVRNPERKPHEVLTPRKAERVQRRTLWQLMADYKVIPKTFAVVCVGAVAASMLFVMTRYNAISAAYTRTNELAAEVEALEKEVERTNVDYLFSIDIGAAHAAAKAAGMVYPTADNIGG